MVARGVTALALVFTLSGSAAAQSIPDPPSEPVWQVLYSYESGATDMLEATTAGRVGDIGYVWLGRFTMAGGPVLVHVTIDCVNRVVHQGGAIAYSLPGLVPGNLQPPPQRDDYAAESEADQNMVDAVCSGAPLTLSPLLYGMASASDYVNTGFPGADPGIPAQYVLPRQAALQRVARIEATGHHLFVETSTAGRVGDTGYAWQYDISPAPLIERPVISHLVINCPSGQVMADWRIELDAHYLIGRQGPESLNNEAASLAAEAIASAVCADSPVDTGLERFASMNDAILDTGMAEIDQMEATSNLPFYTSPETAPPVVLPAGFDDGMLPPVVGVSLVNVAKASANTPDDIYLDENWVIWNEGRAWLFQAGHSMTDSEGRPVAGVWSLLEYGCDPPFTGRVVAKVMVRANGEIVSGELSYARPEILPPGTFHDEVIRATCGGVTILPSEKRFTTLAALMAQPQEGAPPSSDPRPSKTLTETINEATEMELPLAPSPLPPGFDATMLPPASDLSLVRLAGGSNPYDIYLEENWLWHEGGRARAWMFFTAANLTAPDGTPLAGVWSQAEYACEVPHTIRIIAEVSVRANGQIVAGAVGQSIPLQLPPDSFHDHAVRAACDSAPVLTGLERYTSLAALPR